jgi:hypothetical protein
LPNRVPGGKAGGIESDEAGVVEFGGGVVGIARESLEWGAVMQGKFSQ